MVLVTLSITVSSSAWVLISQNGWKAKTSEKTEERIQVYLANEGFSEVQTSIGWSAHPSYLNNRMRAQLTFHRTEDTHILGRHVADLANIIPSRIEAAALILGIKNAKVEIQTGNIFTVYTHR